MRGEHNRVQGDENATDRVVGIGAAMGRCSIVIVDGGSQWGFDLGNSDFLPVKEGLGGGSVRVTTVHVVEVTPVGKGEPSILIDTVLVDHGERATVSVDHTGKRTQEYTGVGARVDIMGRQSVRLDKQGRGAKLVKDCHVQGAAER